jgi:hypothetical protein
MVVHTTEDNTVGDGDPICELARGERENGEEREEREGEEIETNILLMRRALGSLTALLLQPILG